MRTGVVVADHVKVSTSELKEISRSVARLKANFEQARDLVDSYGAEIGSGDVASALDDFADDWKKKRKELCDGLEFLGKTAGAAAKAYDGVDQHLADALLKAQPGDGGKGK
ncbi:type VII secretion target [Streptomyces sp. NPDC005799]|uniref:type VII secretion target n=1 Tax=Streptomyces sp. NPDC005799 TaxID=3154678 RepID=UPI0033ED1C2F